MILSLTVLCAKNLAKKDFFRKYLFYCAHFHVHESHVMTTVTYNSDDRNRICCYWVRGFQIAVSVKVEIRRKSLLNICSSRKLGFVVEMTLSAVLKPIEIFLILGYCLLCDLMDANN